MYTRSIFRLATDKFHSSEFPGSSLETLDTRRQFSKGCVLANIISTHRGGSLSNIPPAGCVRNKILRGVSCNRWAPAIFHVSEVISRVLERARDRAELQSARQWGAEIRKGGGATRWKCSATRGWLINFSLPRFASFPGENASRWKPRRNTSVIRIRRLNNYPCRCIVSDGEELQSVFAMLS